MENSTELVFILDRSGSMAGLEADTIGGYNAMLEKQRAVPGEARVTTVLFDNQCELLHDRIDLRAVAPITEKNILCAVQRRCSMPSEAQSKKLATRRSARQSPIGRTR